MTPPEQDPTARLFAFGTPETGDPRSVWPPEVPRPNPPMYENLTCGIGCFLVGCAMVASWLLYQWMERN